LVEDPANSEAGENAHTTEMILRDNEGKVSFG
jgi:hypothetical protein